LDGTPYTTPLNNFTRHADRLRKAQQSMNNKVLFDIIPGLKAGQDISYGYPYQIDSQYMRASTTAV